MLARPAVVVLVAIFTAIGLAQAGHADHALLFGKAFIAAVALLLVAVALNDVSDERIDRVNLAGDKARPLVAASHTHHEMVAVAVCRGVFALAASTWLAWPAPLVVVADSRRCAAYSLRPVRIADRGVVAPMMLPAVYVAVPYLLGIFAVRGSLHVADLALLAGLYAGFVGRIVLKDFRDVRGDALFGKRTFLVRHGPARRAGSAGCSSSRARWCCVRSCGHSDAGRRVRALLAIHCRYVLPSFIRVCWMLLASARYVQCGFFFSCLMQEWRNFTRLKPWSSLNVSLLGALDRRRAAQRRHRLLSN